MPYVRLPTPDGPASRERRGGLAATVWIPRAPARGTVLVLPGAGSAKESHHDWARACRAAGWTALCVDLPGHGETPGALDAGVLSALRAALHGLPPPWVLRGSSMGGYLALVLAEGLGAAAVIAVCPASADGLRHGLRRDALGFSADVASLEAFLVEHDAGDAAGDLAVPVLLLHAEGDESVPVAHSRELAARLRHPASRLIAVPGGNHRSVQHDAELQGEALRWLQRSVPPVLPPGRGTAEGCA